MADCQGVANGQSSAARARCDKAGALQIEGQATREIGDDSAGKIEKFEFICEEIVAAKNDLLFTVCVTGSSRCLAYTRFFSQEHASTFFHGFFFVK